MSCLRSFAHILIVSFPYCVLRFFTNFGYKYFIIYVFYKYFLPVYECLHSLLTVPFTEQIFNSSDVYLPMFSMDHGFGVISKILSPNPKLCSFFTCVFSQKFHSFVFYI